MLSYKRCLVEAYRLHWYHHAEWKQGVRRLLRECDFVVFDLAHGMTDAVQWEYDEAARLVPHQRIINVVPPEKLADGPVSLLGQSLPYSLRSGFLNAFLFRWRVYKYMSRIQQSEEFEQTIEKLRRSEDHAGYVHCRAEYADALMAAGDFGRALELLEEVLADPFSKLDSERRFATANRLKVIECLVVKQELDAAYQHLLELRQWTASAKSLAPSQQFSIDVHSADLNFVRGHVEEAFAEWNSLLVSCRENYGPDDRRTLLCARCLGVLHELRGERVEAVRLLSDTLDQLVLSRGRFHRETMLTAFVLFELVRKTDRAALDTYRLYLKYLLRASPSVLDLQQQIVQMFLKKVRRLSVLLIVLFLALSGGVVGCSVWLLFRYLA